MFVMSLQRLKLVDFEIGHKNSLLFVVLLKVNAYVVSVIICCRIIDIIYNTYI